MEVILSGQDLTLPEVVAIAEQNLPVRLSKAAAERVQQSRAWVDRFVQERRIVYGLTTGCGPLCTRFIPLEQIEEFQRNLVRSHCAGVGERPASPLVRATMAIRANSLATRCSGVRLSTLQALLDLLNHRIHPVIPEIGSVGASGDLVHLAYMARALMGEGLVEHQGHLRAASEALRLEGLQPVALSYKEGLALINGTSCMTGIGALAVMGTERLIRLADLTAALGLEALLGSTEALDPALQQVRPHPGQIYTARNILR